MFHHDRQKLHDNFGARPDEDLAFASLFCVVDAFQGIGQNVHAHHFDIKSHLNKEENRLKLVVIKDSQTNTFDESSKTLQQITTAK